jgi:hypothetical protein
VFVTGGSQVGGWHGLGVGASVGVGVGGGVAATIGGTDAGATGVTGSLSPQDTAQAAADIRAKSVLLGTKGREG